MRAGEREHVLELLELAFGTREVFERYFEHDPLLSPDDTLLAWEDGRPIACVQTFARRICARRHELMLGGIGSVATHPERRSLGLASRLLEAGMARLRELERPLALLFTTRFSFYERLGFRQVSQRMFRLRRPARPRDDPRSGLWVRDFEPTDLERVRELYGLYCEGLSACTLRDPTYWDAQLRFGTGPAGRFHVAGTGNRLLAYLRCDDLDGRRVAVEYARERSAAGVLAELLMRAVPEERSLFAPIVPDPELGQSLRSRAAFPEPAEDPMPMWCALDPGALAEIAGLPAEASERSLLDALVGGPSAVFWPSDRF